MKILLSQDSFSIARRGDEVAELLATTDAEVVATGSDGLAWLEPLIKIETSSGWNAFGPIDPDKLDRRHLNDPNYWSKEHPCYQGCLSEIDFFERQNRLVFDRCGTRSPFAEDDHAELANILDLSPAEIIEGIRVSNLRGRGGAGFPAHIKWQTVAETEADQKYIVCNADEGDSGTFVDRMLLEGDPMRLIHGMVASGYATGSTKGFVYLRSEYPLAADIFSKSLEQAYAEGVLGENVLDRGFRFDLELFIGAGAYICGEETSLLESLGRKAR